MGSPILWWGVIKKLRDKGKIVDMRKISMLITLSLFLIVCLAYGNEQNQSGRCVNRHELSTGLTAVVAEGDFEPRSIGSYGIRI